MQKSRFHLVAYGLLAVAAVLIVLVACGEGMVKLPQEELAAKIDVNDGYISRCFDNGSPVDNESCKFSSNSNASSSSASSDSGGGEDESSSSEGEGEGEESSSSEEDASSDSEEESSSSTGLTANLDCKNVAPTGIKGTKVNEPPVYCGSEKLSSGFTYIWKDSTGNVKNESFSNPSAGLFFISVKAFCGGGDQDDTCGDILISDPNVKSSSSRASISSGSANYFNCALPSTGTVGVPIDISSAVNCGGTCKCTSSNLTWNGATTSWFSNPTIGTKDITVTGTGGSDCNADCGTITIRSSSSASRSSSSGSGGGDCNRSGWCDYGPGNCHTMPTDDCCASGTIVNSQSACSSGTAKYCSYGECKGGDGWECKTSGGCWQKAESACTSDGGTVVSCCPANTRPPSANYPACN